MFTKNIGGREKGNATLNKEKILEKRKRVRGDIAGKN